MFKIGLFFLYGAFTHLILAIMWGEHLWYQQLYNGGVGGKPIDKVDPVYWKIIILEFIIAISVIIVSVFLNFTKGNLKIIKFTKGEINDEK